MQFPDLPPMDDKVPSDARSVIAFWSGAGPDLWFAKSAEFDATFRERFIELHEAAASRQLSAWEDSAYGALALVILLDQFPRNAFRDTVRMYASDELAVSVSLRALDRALDGHVREDLRIFFYLPFAHSETLADQELSVALAEALPAPIPQHAQRHRDIIHRFGRFPHRNAMLGRDTTEAEQSYLDNGGFKG